MIRTFEESGLPDDVDVQPSRGRQAPPCLNDQAGNVIRVRDLWAGLLFVVLGSGAAIFAALNYRLGTPSSMGPGFFPMLVGIAVAGTGLGVMIQGLVLRELFERGGGSLRALVAVTAGVLAFAALLRPFGLIVSVAILVVIARLARPGRWRETAVLAAVITVLAIAVFVFGLQMPLKVLPL